LSTHADLPGWAVVVACVLAGVSFVLLLVEMRRRERGGAAVLVTGVVALGALLLSIARPVRVSASESVVGARVLVLGDVSRSMALADGSELRVAARDRAVDALSHAKDVRFTVMGFSDGVTRGGLGGEAVGARSDLTAALRAVEAAPEERPEAVVVVSDGRLDDPPEGAARDVASILHVPIHTVGTTRVAPADASVRRVTAAGAAVAHVPLPLRIEVGCAGGLACDELTVTAKELHHDGPPTLLASGLAHVKAGSVVGGDDKEGSATVELPITLERAGVRVVEIALSGASGDVIPDNDRRLVTFNVARERVRVLHVAGRPTNDVRELRQWLKGDASVDLVAFFILRTPTDNVNATQDELALIPFPVDELFSEHLPSFDAVVLQDFDAQPYGLEQHLPALAKYVRTGGGLVMVGGPNSFVAGGYANTPLADVLPVHLEAGAGATAADPAPFVPSWTTVGRDVPMLGPLRNVVGGELPEMPGANVLEDARPGALVLWSHPRRRTKSGAPMPVLAVSDVGNGRAIALGIDGGWLLDFSDLGTRTGGRAYGALWDGLLGWLMRDPRFEPAQLEVGACVAQSAAVVAQGAALGAQGHGVDAKRDKDVTHPKVVVRAISHEKADITLDVTRMDGSADPVHIERKDVDLGAAVELDLPPLVAGGYSALLKVGDGAATRRDFACEVGGDEWADSRPDPQRLRDIASATGGSFRFADQAGALDLPKATVVSAERHVAPIAPPWVWALLAALAVGAHWYARRKSGLS
jgi:uncharacterized membrane protein